MTRADVLALLRCPACRSPLSPPTSTTTAGSRSGAGPDALVCDGCGRRVPVVGGIPRFVDRPGDALAERTQASFGYEWTHFSDWRQSGETNFNDYFQGVDLAALRGRLVLDAGCGMGRHARQIARHAGQVVAVDFSGAIDQTYRNVADLTNVACLQSDLMTLPLADNAFDFVYSMGVLHHLSDTDGALQQLVRKVRPGGRLRIYLYWKRHGWKGRVLALVSLARRVTTRTPFPLLRAMCWTLSVLLYPAVVLPYRLLSALGVRAHEGWPLFVYSKYPFTVLYNDQFDRFSAPLEKRYDQGEVSALLERAGLRDVQVRPCFGWLADGTKPA